MKKFSLISLLFVVACVSASKLVPTAEVLPAMQQKVPGITLEQAQLGFSAYKQNCSGCHRLHAPSQYTPSEWDKSLAEMFPKAKVKDMATQELIRDYVHALSK